MLLKQIEYFVSIVEENSFTRAAERHFISQSAISQAVAALEKDLDTQLIQRNRRTFLLTPAGQFFYRRGKKLLSELQAVREETVRIGRNEEGPLSIGYLNLYAGPELYETIAEFSALYPEVEISTVSGTHEDLYRGLTDGTIDLALNDQRRAFSEDYVNLELANAGCLIEVARRQVRPEIDRIDLRSLPDLPCILVSAKENEAGEAEYYQNVLGFSGDFLFARSLEEARLMVAGGRGFLLVEAIGKLPEPTGAIRRIPLYRGKRHLTRNYCLFWRKERTNYYIEEFAESFRQRLV